MRQLYKDPVTGGDFKLILGSEGAIMGVVSESRDAPFKKDDFDKELKDFGNAKTYADWKFETKPGAPQGIAPGASSSDFPARIGH